MKFLVQVLSPPENVYFFLLMTHMLALIFLFIHIILKYNITFFFFSFQPCDISLRAGVTTLSAHRVVLAAASPYFHAMFNGKLLVGI